jgi:hypothetical protein
MPEMIAAYVWLDSHRQSHRYLREIVHPVLTPSSPRGTDRF